MFEAGNWGALWKSSEEAWKKKRGERQEAEVESAGGETLRKWSDAVISKVASAGVSRALNMVISEGTAEVDDHVVTLVRGALAADDKKQLPEKAWRQYAERHQNPLSRP